MLVYDSSSLAVEVVVDARSRVQRAVWLLWLYLAKIVDVTHNYAVSIEVGNLQEQNVLVRSGEKCTRLY